MNLLAFFIVLTQIIHAMDNSSVCFKFNLPPTLEEASLAEVLPSQLRCGGFYQASKLFSEVSGIYCAVHIQTLRCYIGSSVNVGSRLKSHWRRARDGSQMCFHKALRQFGIDEFEFELIEKCEKSQLLVKEEFWIKFYNSASLNGFNTLSKPTATYGTEISEATRARMGAAQKGRKISHQHIMALRAGYAKANPRITPEHRVKLNKARKEKPITPEIAYRLGNGQRGKKHSENHKRKIGLSLIGNKHLLGHKHSELSKSKISMALTGRKVSKETRQLLRERTMAFYKNKSKLTNLNQLDLL